MKEKTTKIGQKILIGIMVAAAAALGVLCWIGGFGRKLKKKK